MGVGYVPFSGFVVSLRLDDCYLQLHSTLSSWQIHVDLMFGDHVVGGLDRVVLPSGAYSYDFVFGQGRENRLPFGLREKAWAAAHDVLARDGFGTVTSTKPGSTAKYVKFIEQPNILKARDVKRVLSEVRSGVGE